MITGKIRQTIQIHFLNDVFKVFDNKKEIEYYLN